MVYIFRPPAILFSSSWLFFTLFSVCSGCYYQSCCHIVKLFWPASSHCLTKLKLRIGGADGGVLSGKGRGWWSWWCCWWRRWWTGKMQPGATNWLAKSRGALWPTEPVSATMRPHTQMHGANINTLGHLDTRTLGHHLMPHLDQVRNTTDSTTPSNPPPVALFD